MTVTDVRRALTGEGFPGERRIWWVTAEIISLAYEATERIAAEFDHWANVAMSKAEQGDTCLTAHLDGTSE